ncbi:mitochondrial inner membrane protease ATP23 homolog isoform X1 [Limulus polyphemus]|uniref:Mitochondrial inner membrane protease ATP23 n=1 Tax=Limulus polyphemus TaxID=6850 RepID=A0ABM1BA56_LIMPO|nr:mitochondrial inner membrane protease ATP23 homolog isoform X1 [Limulus polyphemus]
MDGQGLREEINQSGMSSNNSGKSINNVNEEKKNVQEKITTEDIKNDTYNEDSFKLYPERRGKKYNPTWFETAVLGESRREIDKAKCERNVYSCLEKSPLIKLMMSALKGSGCEVDISRHISCEVCDKKVSGGYDPELNQVVVCQNVARSEWMVQGVLAHEFVHMFDYCRAKLDFRNVDHLACTEVRAANLMHCSFLSAAVEGTASPFHIAKAHSDCVKNKAVASVLAVRNVSEQEAKTAVERVFKRCYNDLEPVGRRLRRNSLDMEKAYRQRFHYGYFD